MSPRFLEAIIRNRRRLPALHSTKTAQKSNNATQMIDNDTIYAQKTDAKHMLNVEEVCAEASPSTWK